MEIPFVKDIKEFMNNIHKKSMHKGINGMRDELLNRRIYYKGIIKDIEFTIKNCPICSIKKKNKNFVKKEKFNLIIFHKPRERYIADLSYIPLEFTNNKDCKNYEINNKYRSFFQIR